MIHLHISTPFFNSGNNSSNQMPSQVKLLLQRIKQELLPVIQIRSVNPHEPVEVDAVPPAWRLLGTGNYAAVVYHTDYPAYVVKLYAADRPGFEEEVEVYRRLGHHPAFSQCLYAKNDFLVLRRLNGVTLYDCLNRGIAIPRQVIQDVDRALEYARSRGLHPRDIHGRNVMMHQGRGLVVDVSDFLQEEPCTKWRDLKLAYYWFYRPFFMPLRLRVPYSLLDQVRRGYRFLHQVMARRKKSS